ncbi:hypothetical protein NKH47_04125 [Mesorhizobium sp. M1060]|uniref:hypothetical protein n=1 Tax=unclassified Mesorhizobium TaxID=325217 RepID=UPI0003CFEE01|nr:MULTISPECIES: hypothetical protein [unclassified Mesorhizobium]ESZ04419.1 hypothetical protein X736_22110 [Mesorhizobium sp. L2C089B000]WJI52363.1 hypothetical protein NLY44_06725 [Mesorhizobium sp. C089B]
MEEKLPTDEEFLDSLFEASPDSRSDPTEDTAFLSEAVSMLRAGNVFPVDTDISQKVKEMFDPQRAFRGWATQGLRDHAVSFLGADEQYLRSIPVGMLFLRELNGYAIKTPRGGAVIVLDKGILVIAGMLARCMLALTSWSSPEPYCRDHTPADFVAAILCLANFDVTADYRYLDRVKVRHCPSLDPWDLQSVKLGLLIESFALLHEYGHIACGHVKSADTAGGISQHHAREFEADEFAFHRLSSKHDLRAVGIAVVTFFRFLDLTEHVRRGKSHSTDTHPAAIDRWQRLCTSSGLKDPGKDHVVLIESMFDMILSVEPKFLKTPIARS